MGSLGHSIVINSWRYKITMLFFIIMAILLFRFLTRQSYRLHEFSIAGSKLDRDLSFNSLCATLGDVTAELIIQPHQAITLGGGGETNNEQGWRDDKNKDNPRNEPFYKPSKCKR